MDSNTFNNLLQKISRANAHIEDFNSKASLFLRKHRSVVIQDDISTGYRSIRMIGSEPIPLGLGLIIGDAMHNLRSALDNVIWELVSPHKPESPKKVQYPFVEDPTKLDDAIQKRLVHLAGPNVINIIKSSNPYRGGDKNLWAVHELNNIDKHRTPLFAEQVLFLKPGKLTQYDPSAPSNYTFTDGAFIGGSVSWPIPVGNRHQRRKVGISPSGHKLKLPLELVFGQGLPFAGDRVVPLLKDATNKVAQIIHQLNAISVSAP